MIFELCPSVLHLWRDLVARRGSTEEVQAVLDDFERVAFAGMAPDRYSSLRPSGTTGMSFTARVELRSGLSPQHGT
jgi:hypothetical protein